MNNFLKPTKGKIIFTLAIILILAFCYFIAFPCATNLSNAPAYCNSYLNRAAQVIGIVLAVASFPALLVSFAISQFSGLKNLNFNSGIISFENIATILIISIVFMMYWYFIACLFSHLWRIGKQKELKSYFKPTIKKIIVTVILSVVLFLLFSYLSSMMFPVMDGPNIVGMPFTYQVSGCSIVFDEATQGAVPRTRCINEFYWKSFIFDVLFWLIIFYFIISLLAPIKNK